VVRQSLRPPVVFAKREIAMDYVIAGITAVFLFAYLIDALLRPERF
jgi:K+-transporting ATPase KdpF subunit